MYLQSIHLTRMLSRLITVKPQQSEWLNTWLLSAECGSPLKPCRVVNANLVLYPTIIPAVSPAVAQHGGRVHDCGWLKTIGEEHVTEVAPMSLVILAACLGFQVSCITTRVTSRVSCAAQTKQEHQSEDGVSQVFEDHS